MSPDEFRSKTQDFSDADVRRAKAGVLGGADPPRAARDLERFHLFTWLILTGVLVPDRSSRPTASVSS